MPEQQTSPVKVFISYAHEDCDIREILEKHLSSLKHERKIIIWQDQEIPAGANWEEQIDTHINEADLILLLVSSDFIASKYCWNKEVESALKRHKEGSARIIPIILRPIDWKNTPLGELQALPARGIPVMVWTDKDTAFQNVVQGIRRVVENLTNRSPQSPIALLREKVATFTQLPMSRREYLAITGSVGLVGAGVGTLGYSTVTSLKPLREIRMIFIQSSLPNGFHPDQFIWALEQTSGLRVATPASNPGYDDCVKRFGEGEFNVLWDGPFAYVITAARYGVQPILQLKNLSDDPLSYYCRVLTKRSTNIRTLADLNRRTLALVHRYSTSGGLAPRYALHKSLVNEESVQMRYFNTHEDALESVISGNTDAAAVSDEFYKEKGGSRTSVYRELLNKYHVADEDVITIWKSDSLPMGPITVHNDMLERDVWRLRSAFFQLADDPALLASLGISGFRGVSDATYDKLRNMAHELNIDLKTC
jgi:phosphate/phosphite/phosphonate ABC transporter binding protein